MPIKPHRRNGPGWYVTFRNPYKQGLVTSGSLITRDEVHANEICRDIERLRRDKTLWENPAAPRLSGYDARAVELFFGVDHVAGQVRRLAPGALELLHTQSIVIQIFQSLSLQAKPSASQVEKVGRMLLEFDSAETARLKELLAQREQRLKVIEPELAAARDELQKLRREANQHVKTRLGEAAPAFMAVYKIGRAPKTARFMQGTLDLLLAHDGTEFTITPETRLAEIRPAMITEWYTSLKIWRGVGEHRKQAAPSPVTLRNRFHALAAFFEWTTTQYDMNADPMARMQAPAGTARLFEHIVAIRDEQVIRELIAALEPWLYWQAWVAVACLQGLRWGEQSRMLTANVRLREMDMRVATILANDKKVGTKTGRERHLPLEQTVVLPILEKYLQCRKLSVKRARKMKGLEGVTNAAWASPFLFPTVVKDNVFKPRKLTQPGLWCHSSNWILNWKRIREEVKVPARMKDALKLGPREWRHTCGTAQGNCGWDSLRISRFLGNSEDVARKHYIAPGSGKPWGFKW